MSQESNSTKEIVTLKGLKEGVVFAIVKKQTEKAVYCMHVTDSLELRKSSEENRKKILRQETEGRVDITLLSELLPSVSVGYVKPHVTFEVSEKNMKLR